MKRRGTTPPDRPPEHCVSAVFDEPFDRFGTIVLRWWYGDMMKEQHCGPSLEVVKRYKRHILRDDLDTMEQRVWGTVETHWQGHSTPGSGMMGLSRPE